MTHIFYGLNTTGEFTTSTGCVIDMGTNVINNVGQPLLGTDAATKQYIDDINDNNYEYVAINAATYTALVTDRIIGVLYSVTGICTITLPQISTITGNKKRYTIVDEGGNAAINNIIIQGSGGDTINGGTFTLNGNYDSVALYNNTTTGWFVGA